MDQRDPKTGAILGAAIEVHKTLGPGFLEMVYQHALAEEMSIREISFAAQVPMPVEYKGVRLKCGYRADFLVFGSILVEIKAQSGLTEADEAQVINYLHASGLRLALLLNFGCSKLQIKRYVLTKPEAHEGIEEDTATID